MSKKSDLTHFDDSGRPRMVNVGDKNATDRSATARGRVTFSRDAYAPLKSAGVKKGDVAKVAELAGIMAAKKTSDLIPLCHPLPLTNVSMQVDYADDEHALIVSSTVKTHGPTGVEMEALTAVSVACLTIYDMAKSIDKSMTIGPVELTSKTGGKSGDFQREA